MLPMVVISYVHDWALSLSRVIEKADLIIELGSSDLGGLYEGFLPQNVEQISYLGYFWMFLLTCTNNILINTSPFF
jgi:hypothetical protein